MPVEWLEGAIEVRAETSYSERNRSSVLFLKSASFYGNIESETAKSLPVCKAVPSTTFGEKDFLPKVVLGVPH